MLKGFKEFILRGNVIDLAVAVVIGTAFTAVVTSLVTNLFNPAIGALFKAESLNALWVLEIPTLDGTGTAKIMFGAVIASIIQFLIIAAVVYFVLIVPINYLKKVSFKKKVEEVGPTDTPPTELELLAEIRDLLANVDQTPTHGKHNSPPETVDPPKPSA